jgi:tetratricopeptide (TPR) repeat protein
MQKFFYQVISTGALALSVLCASAQTAPSNIKYADSLYYAQDWPGARAAYAKLLTDTSTNSIAWNRFGFCNYNTGRYNDALYDYKKALENHPIPPVKGSAYSRMARINALQNHTGDALTNIDSAITWGYVAYSELDSLKDFNNIRGNANFKKLRDKAFFTANPCMADPKARVFDFWTGNWNVYNTGTHMLVGRSRVQIISGGCALLENWESLGNASSGKSLNFIDANSKWRQCWVGSYPGGQQDFVDGEYNDGAMRFTFSTTDAQGHKLMGRFIFYNQGADKVRQFNETSADGGKTWTTAYDLTYLRVKR